MTRARRVMAATVCPWALLLLVAASAAGQEPQDQRALLSLSVNEGGHGETLVVIRGADVLVEVAALERAGLRAFAGLRETIDGRAFVSLTSLGPGVRFRLDEEALSLSITADAAHLGTVVVDLRPARPVLQYSRATSAFLNYGANWSRVGGVNGSIESGVSIGPALALSTVSWDPTRGLVRGLSNVVIDERDRLRRWTIGDTLVSAKVLGSGMLLGGVHVSREYALDPYFVQFPTLGLSGTALTPSTVDVYVNDRLVSREQVAPGSFDLAHVPMASGSNSARVVVKDAFGREQQMSAPFYLSTSALARGLQDYDYAVGYARVGGASANWNYGHLSALARHRYGFSDNLTAGVVAEADSGTVAAGPTVNYRLHAGEIELAASGSRSRGSSGGALAAGYVYLGRRVSFSARFRSMSSGYSTLTLRRPEDRARVEASGMAGAQLGPRISVSVQHAVAEAWSGERQARTSLLGTVTLSRRVNLFVNVSRSRTDGKPGTELYAGINVPLAERTSSSVWLQRGPDGSAATAEVQRSLPIGDGYGYRARTVLGDASHAELMLEAQGRYGHYEAGQELLNGVRSPHLSVNGGLVAIGGTVQPARPIVDSYALVRVPDVSGVRTYLNNQEIGTTDRRGDVFVSNLLPYYANRVGISDEDVPIDRNLETVEQSVAPPFRGGALVVFRAARRRTAAGTVTIAAGGQTIVPALGELTVSVGNEVFSSPIGHNGEFYFENLPAGRHPAVVVAKGSTCRFELSVPESAGPALQLGIVRCILPEVREP